MADTQPQFYVMRKPGGAWRWIVCQRGRDDLALASLDDKAQAIKVAVLLNAQADELAALQLENERLRGALEITAAADVYADPATAVRIVVRVSKIALNPKEPEV